jgi:hypothetical protein
MISFVKRHPLEVLLPTRGARMSAALTVAFGTVWVSWIMQRLVRGVEPGILAFEFATTPARAAGIIAHWGIGGEARMLAQIRLDNWWLALYSTTLALLCIMIATRLSARSPRWANAGRALAWAAWVAALFDRMENLALVRTIEHGPAWSTTIAASVLAALKFSIILACLLFILTSPISHRIAFFSRKQPNNR